MTDPSDAQRAVYEHRAEEYDALVRAEDCDENLPLAIRRAFDPAGKRVVEAGAGTGRLTRLLLEMGASVHATERAAPMLEVARREVSGDVRWSVADARELPVEDGSADAFVAGWVFGHFRLWMPDGWRAEVGQALAEARRVLEPGGAIVILETLGTGVDSPQFRPALEEYFGWLESEHGLTRDVIATDYAFETAEAAAVCLGGFFGDAMAAKIRDKGWARVPEYTGVWSGVS